MTAKKALPRRDAQGRFVAKSAPRTSKGPSPRAPLGRGVAVEPARKAGAYNPYGYQSAREATREGRHPVGASGDRHAQYDRGRLVDQSREFMRNNGIYQGMIDRAVTYVVGGGFQPQVTSEKKDFDDTVEGLWREYWRGPEVRGVLSGVELEEMVCRELFVCGDTLLLKVKGGLLQQIEAEQVAGPQRKDDGIGKNIYGKPVRFHVCPYDRGGRPSIEKKKSYSPADVLYIANLDRPSSTRGVVPSQASFAMLHRIKDVCDSEAIAWQILARMAISITRDGGPQLGHAQSRTDDTIETTDGALAPRISELGYALIFHGEQGDDIRGIDRNIPGKSFPESIRMFLRLLGLPLGLPLELILLDWTKSNYSQSRAVLEQAYRTFQRWQGLLERRFHGPVFEWKVAEWEAARLISVPKAGYRVAWIKPTFPWIDQKKETEAYALKVALGFATLTDVCKTLGREREEVLDARAKEIEKAIELVQKIQTATGVDVPWQHFAGLEVPREKPADAESKPKPKPDDEDDDEEEA